VRKRDRLMQTPHEVIARTAGEQQKNKTGREQERVSVAREQKLISNNKQRQMTHI